MIGRRMRTDPGLQSVDALIELGKLIAFSAGNPIVQVALPPVYSYGSDGASYVEATEESIRASSSRRYSANDRHPGSTATDHALTVVADSSARAKYA